jgi:hypothetical protein
MSNGYHLVIVECLKRLPDNRNGHLHKTTRIPSPHAGVAGRLQLARRSAERNQNGDCDDARAASVGVNLVWILHRPCSVMQTSTVKAVLPGPRVRFGVIDTQNQLRGLQSCCANRVRGSTDFCTCPLGGTP